jgi:hypothetical protein
MKTECLIPNRMLPEPTMKIVYKSVIAILCVLVLSSCQAPTRTMELSVSLKVPAGSEAKPVNALDVLVAVETVASDNGLKPWSEPADDEDLLGLAETDDASSAAGQSWRHPDFPVYLTATRHPGEILLLLNYPAEAAPDPKAQKLFNTVKTQLSAEVSKFLNPASAPTESKPK